MEILLTGGSGTIGSFVGEELRDRGHDVTVFDIKEPAIDGVEYVQGDTTDASAVASAVDDVDTVVHMAALLPPACQASPRRAQRVNVGGTVNVLEEAPADTRIVYVSSKSVFGVIAGDHGHPTYDPISEDAPRNPINVYGTTKLAGEEFCREYARRGKSIAVLRFSSTYGPGKGEDYGELAFVAQAIARATEEEHITLPGGDQMADLIYFGDIARGVADAVETPEWGYRTYHLGSGTLVSPRDLARCLEEQLSVDVTVEDGLNYRNMEFPTYCRLDISRARADLGYEPAFSFSEGIQDYLDRVEG